MQPTHSALGPLAQINGNNFKEGTTSTQYIAQFLGLPENLTVQCIIAIGYPGEEMVPIKG